MMDDIETLIQHRWAGRVPEGHRNATVFLYATFLIHGIGPERFKDAVHAFAGRICDLADAEVEAIIASVLSQYGKPEVSAV